MFLSSPGISELKILDLPLLLEMLVQQTEDYIHLIKDQGFSERTEAAKDLLERIQAAIASKQNLATPIINDVIFPQSVDNGPQNLRKIA